MARNREEETFYQFERPRSEVEIKTVRKKLEVYRSYKPCVRQ